MKLKLLLFLALFSITKLEAQILTFEFSALAGNEATANSNFNDSNLTNSTISRGAGLTAAANAGRYNATGWALTSIANAVAGDDYMEFTITPNAGYNFDVTSIVVSLQRSATGQRGIALRSSADGYTTDLGGEQAIADVTTTQTFTFTFSQTNNSAPVTYRMYMYAEAGTGSGGPGDFAGNDIIVNGSVYPGSGTPTITVSTNTLSGFFYVVGSGPSAEQSFNVNGANLTNNITLSAPANYEISLTSGGVFSSSIILTQVAGLVPLTTVYVRLISGLPVNTYNGEIISASSIGAASQNITCNGSVTNPSTVFTPGDFAVIAVNSNITCYPAGPNGAYSAGDDEISFITFKDILNGDSFYITDNGFQRVTANEWGDTEGVYLFTRTGGTIPAGTVITFRLLNTNPFVEFHSPDANWVFNKVAGFGGNLVMNSGGDQIFFTQGGTWTNPAGTHDATYTGGEYVYGFNTNSGWNSFINSTQQSGLPINLNCFSLMPGSATDFLEYTGPITPATKLDWIARLNNPVNWTNRIDCLGYLSTHVGQTYSVLTGGVYIDGVWTGTRSTDWFDCSNWQTLEVPDNTIDVNINNTYAIRDAVIDITSPLAPTYSNLAVAHNIDITDRSLIIEGNANNILEVHGNLMLDGTGIIDMDDSNSSTADGTIFLYGNWTNNRTESEFQEGNSTIHFVGSTDQIINNVAPIGTEVFYDVVLNNNFTTNISNNLIATGNLTVNTGRTATVSPNNYIQVNNNLTVNGNFNVLDDGSLIQVNDGAINTGSISYQRITTGNTNDYVYWSSPVNGVNTPSGYIYAWDSDVPNTNGGLGNWIGAGNTLMLPGVGYIMRNIFSRTFFGQPRNGLIQPTITRGSYQGVDYPGTNGITITRFSDNWNLVGNPYPSAINVLDFLALNPNIEGAVRIWTHNTPLSTAIPNPFYGSFVANYTPNDYITYNGVGTVSGPAGFNGFIGGGQAFMVNMNDGSASTESIIFNNSLRSRVFNNSQFYRTESQVNSNVNNVEKHRIWLDITNQNNVSERVLIGYLDNATYEKDRLYDAVTSVVPNFLKIYTLIDQDKMTIEGRPLPFNVNDKVLLGVNVPTSGNYTIALAAVDGLFANNQRIYIEDKYLGIVHNLKEAPYSFTSDNSGEINDRFIIRYTRKANPTNDNNLNNQVIINNDINGININFNGNIVHEIIIHDILGREICNIRNKNEQGIIINSIEKNNQPLIISIINIETGKVFKIRHVY